MLSGAAAHLHAHRSTTPGPRTATSVSLSDTLPAGVTYVFPRPPPRAAACASGNTVTCALGNVASGANPSVEIKVTGGAGAGIGHESGHGAGLLHRPEHRKKQLERRRSTVIKPVADLALTKSDGPDPVLAGQLLTYTLGVSERRAPAPPRA